MDNFESKFKELEVLKERYSKKKRILQTGLDRIYRREFVKQYPKRKKYNVNLISGRDRIFKIFKKQADRITKKYVKTKRELDVELYKIAHSKSLPVDESTYRLYQIIDSGNYISQGFFDYQDWRLKCGLEFMEIRICRMSPRAPSAASPLRSIMQSGSTKPTTRTTTIGMAQRAPAMLTH